MSKTVRGVLEAPTLLRLDESVELPLHVPVDVTIAEPAPKIDAPNDEVPASSFIELALSGKLQIDGPSDFSERWEEYIAEDERERNR